MYNTKYNVRKIYVMLITLYSLSCTKSILNYQLKRIIVSILHIPFRS